MGPNIADIIAKECINHYQSLGKKGKPVIGKEWTLLACVVMTLDGKNTVVAMATGTKCLGRNEMSPRGDLVNDSHAEVLARRCFLRYLYDQVMTFQRTGASVVIVGCNEKNQYEMNPDIKFHFYSSHVPCGDASIIPKHGLKRKCDGINNEAIQPKKMIVPVLKEQMTDDCAKNCQDENNMFIDEFVMIKNQNQNLVVRESNSFKTDPIKLANSDDGCTIGNNFQSVHNSDEPVVGELDECVGEIVDVYRTGAKCLQGEDRKLPGALYHQVGAVRTKPGRGDPTLSVSCSDKMARWLVCGLQGALLSLLLSRPVMLASVIVGSGGPYSQEVLKRALLSRSQISHSVSLLHSSVIFPHSRYSVGLCARPCPSAILWTRVSDKPLQVCVEGRRQGVTKNCCENGRLAICKLELLKAFLTVARKAEYEDMSYKALKALAAQYNKSSNKAKSALGMWTSKPPHLEHFKLHSHSGYQ